MRNYLRLKGMDERELANELKKLVSWNYPKEVQDDPKFFKDWLNKDTLETRVDEVALRELQLVEKQCKDEMSLHMQKVVTDNVMELMQVLNSQGHSGFSVHYVLDIFNKLVKNRPLTPLTDDPEEWNDITYNDDKTLYQNKRCSAVFKEVFRDGTQRVYYLDGKSFSDDGGKSWYTNGNSHVELHLPCMLPETERIILKEGEDNDTKEHI